MKTENGKIMILSMQIPTIVGREERFQKLQEHLLLQCQDHPDVEVIFLKDNKEISIGAKRQKLYEMSKGKWSVQIDDDDSVADDYVEQILAALEQDPDCVGYIEDITMDGKHQQSSISNTWPMWKANYQGWNYVRTPYFKVPIKTELCLAAGVKDMRFGEDHDFARRIHPMLNHEIYLDIPMYYYNRVSNKNETHNERYGIR
jgi:glycosyltransferase involved in cell wall biosynthesis